MSTSTCSTGPTRDSSMDAWVREYEDAKQLADDALAIIQARGGGAKGYLMAGLLCPSSLGSQLFLERPGQYRSGMVMNERRMQTAHLPAQERNLKHPHGGQEASRVTAVARRKLGSLATAIDGMRDALDSPAASSMCACY